MFFNTQYEAYNSSWGNFLGLVSLPRFVGKSLLQMKHFGIPDFNAPFINTLPSLICFGISAGYFIHNLYAQYQHNQSLEAQLKVEIDGEVKTVTASPNYFDWYSAYNELHFIGLITEIIGIGIGNKDLYAVSKTTKIIYM